MSTTAKAEYQQAPDGGFSADSLEFAEHGETEAVGVIGRKAGMPRLVMENPSATEAARGRISNPKIIIMDEPATAAEHGS
ncbi:MAG: hypothetical protein AAFV49_06295, partial [Pseudomonadota bacterium]